MGIIKEKYMLSSRRETVALSASAVKSVRFVDARKCGYRVSDGRHIGIFGVAGNATPEQEAWKRAEENLANRIPYSAQPAANRSEHVDVSGGHDVGRFPKMLPCENPELIPAQTAEAADDVQHIALLPG